jgi:hypothetical protein
MKRITKAAWHCLLAGGGALAAVGCTEGERCYDPCYPERYNYRARQEVLHAMAPQVQNGHILDQTMWNYFFDEGSDKLTEGGRDHLNGLVRRRPNPDARIYLATARDLAYDAANPQKYVDGRRDLDNRRVAAIQAYLGAQTAGRPMAFEVVVHDPMETGLDGESMNRSMRLYRQSSRGTLAAAAAATADQGAAGGGAGTGGQSGNAGAGGVPAPGAGGGGRQ